MDVDKGGAGRIQLPPNSFGRGRDPPPQKGKKERGKREKEGEGEKKEEEKGKRREKEGKRRKGGERGKILFD